VALLAAAFVILVMVVAHDGLSSALSIIVMVLALLSLLVLQNDVSSPYED
jgi:hypothetical protein